MSDEQLQLFEGPERPVRFRRRMPTSLGHATLRHDHAVLLAMTALIVASVVFALGVERGKRLAKTESRSLRTIAESIPNPSASIMPVAVPSAPVDVARVKASAAPAPVKPAKMTKKPSRLAAETSNFAVQVVSYSQVKFAQQELRQLQRRGEHAFLLQQQGRMTLLVGPFPTKEHAVSKLSTLRQRYEGCFVRTL